MFLWGSLVHKRDSRLSGGFRNGNFEYYIYISDNSKFRTCYPSNVDAQISVVPPICRKFFEIWMTSKVNKTGSDSC